MNYKRMAVIVGVAGVFLILTGTVTLSTYAMRSYNALNEQSQAVHTSQAQVETQYQRRLDLVPSLVSSVRGIMGHEQAVFGKLAEARSHYAGASGPDKVTAMNQMDSALARLMVVIENYPNLHANEQVQELMAQLEGTENRVNVARQRYNETVQAYDTNVTGFPGRFFASWFGFKEAPYFTSVAEAKAMPKFSLGGPK